MTIHEQRRYLGISSRLCELNLEVKEFRGWLLHLLSIRVLLADQVLVGLLIHSKKS